MRTVLQLNLGDVRSTAFAACCTLFILLAAFRVSTALAGGLACDELFASNHLEVEKLNEMILTLSRLQLTIDLSRVRGGQSIELRTLERDLQHQMNKIMDQGVMTERELRARMREEIIHLQLQLAKEQKQQREEHLLPNDRLIDGTQIVFNEVLPGFFDSTVHGMPKAEMVDRAFELAAIPTTQLVWMEVVSRAQKRFLHEYDEIPLDPSDFKDSLAPVESVSRDDIHLWINALNQLVSENDPLINQLFPGHQTGDVYRLPTVVEREFVLRARGKAQGAFAISDKRKMKNYAWFSKNSGTKDHPEGQTHPVATKLPIKIDGHDFYDLHGNINEEVDGSQLSSLPGIYVGGGWDADLDELEFGQHAYHIGRDGKTNTIGFRLARSRP